MLMTETLVHRDIHGKEVYYLKISRGTEVQFINVSKREYDKVNLLNWHEPIESLPKLPFDETDNQTTTGGTEEKKLEGIQHTRRPRHGRETN